MGWDLDGWGNSGSSIFTAVQARLAALLPFCGTGRHGNITVPSGQTVIAEDTHYNNVTIQTGGRLIPAGWGLYIAGTLTLQGDGCVNFDGNSASGSSAGTARNGTTVGNSVAGGAGGAAVSTGVGNSGGTSTNGGIGGATIISVNTGGAGSGGAGGAAGSQASISGAGLRPGPLQIPRLSSGGIVTGGSSGPGGGAGGGNGTQAGGPGGGGGAGGGVVYCVVNTINISAATPNSPAFRARGGLGANGTNAVNTNTGGGGAGAPGGGGAVMVAVGTIVGGPSTNFIDVSGRDGSTGGNGNGTGIGGRGSRGSQGGYACLYRADLGTTTVAVTSNPTPAAPTTPSTTAGTAGTAGEVVTLAIS